jgi:hypothetical protein
MAQQMGIYRRSLLLLRYAYKNHQEKVSGIPAVVSFFFAWIYFDTTLVS